MSDTNRMPDWSAIQAHMDAMREAEWCAANESNTNFVGDDKFEEGTHEEELE